VQKPSRTNQIDARIEIPSLEEAKSVFKYLAFIQIFVDFNKALTNQVAKSLVLSPVILIRGAAEYLDAVESSRGAANF